MNLSQVRASLRDLMVHRSSLQLAAALDRLADALLEQATQNFEPRLVATLLDARALLQQHRAALSEEFLKRLTRRIDQGVNTELTQEATPTQLELQSIDVLDEQVAARTLARNIEGAIVGDLPLLHARSVALIGRPDLKLSENPFSPQSLVACLHEAMIGVCDSRPVRTTWLRVLGSLGPLGFTDVYRDLNRFLTDAGVSAPAASVTAGRVSSPTGSVASASLGRGADAASTSAASPRVGEDAGAGADPGDASMRTLLTNLTALIERIQGVVPGIAGGPGVGDPAVASMLRAREAMQVSAALGFAPDGSVRGAVPTAVDPQLLDSLSTLQTAYARSGAEELGLAGVGRAAEDQAASAPARSILRAVVPGYGSGQMSVLDATTTELVAMLFEFAFARRELRDEIKVLIGRLQIPTLKAAMLDRGFFSRKNHPARILINKLADAGIGWSPNDGIDDPLYRKIAAIVDQINRDFVDDLGVFTAAIVEIEQFMAEHEQNVRPAVEAELAMAREADRQLLALKAARDAVATRLQQNALPQVVGEFIELAWRPHLEELALEVGCDSPAFNEALATLDELIWSVAPKPQPTERAELGNRLPPLVRRLRDGLSKFSDATLGPLFDRLFEVHSGLLRGASPQYTDPPAPVEPPAPDVFAQIVAQMERNQWIELSDENGALTYAKLAWISPQRTTYLFVTRHGRKAASVTPEELAEWFRSDRARIIESEPLVDQALARMFAEEAKAA
ncbi:MAG: DUF1631 domain-containing protein [Casimicrobiaceae bacterium]|nr:DUF1631 domain-containing protein [Casimicrobiaceae bacterium]MDW8311265.1 DUF1631 family protein [Burkholderiales bacterium]